MSAPSRTENSTTILRYILIAGLVVVVFLVSYNLAAARSATPSPGATGLAPTGSQSGATADASGAGCACCSNTGSGESVEGQTVLDGDVQRISVDASAGYNPNVIRAKAGVPLEITFSEGFGCMAEVISADLGFAEDLTTGPKTVSIPALGAGEYGFSCGMEMVFGTIVVE